MGRAIFISQPHYTIEQVVPNCISFSEVSSCLSLTQPTLSNHLFWNSLLFNHVHLETFYFRYLLHISSPLIWIQFHYFWCLYNPTELISTLHLNSLGSPNIVHNFSTLSHMVYILFSKRTIKTIIHQSISTLYSAVLDLWWLILCSYHCHKKKQST